VRAVFVSRPGWCPPRQPVSLCGTRRRQPVCFLLDQALKAGFDIKMGLKRNIPPRQHRVTHRPEPKRFSPVTPDFLRGTKTARFCAEAVLGVSACLGAAGCAGRCVWSWEGSVCAWCWDCCLGAVLELNNTKGMASDGAPLFRLLAVSGRRPLLVPALGV